MEERELIQSCLEGNKRSLELLINSIQGLVFNLSLRFLWNRMDAEDATQEILVKVITNLSKFDGRSKLKTWTYKVATNYLLNIKQTALEKNFTSFDVFASDLNTAKSAIDYELPDKKLLERKKKKEFIFTILKC